MRTLAVLLLFASFGAQAEVYRCERSGKTVYSDKPCGDGTPAQAVRAPNRMDAPPPAQRKLAKQYDERIERDRKARDKADAAWVREYDAQQKRRTEVRSAIEQRKAVRGMTESEVRMALGPPEHVTPGASSKNGDTEQWLYRQDRGAKLTVTFKNGSVSAVSGAKGKKRK